MESTASGMEHLKQSSTNDDGMRILVVDDEASIRSSLAQLLKVNYQNVEIDTAASAEEALSLVEHTDVDIVVTDFKLPRMDGLELTRLLAQISPKTAPILMTAYGNESIIHQAHSSGCSAYIEKPLDIDLLFSFIDKALVPENKLKAELNGISLADLIRFYSIKKESVVLDVSAGTTSGLLVLDEGDISHAQFGSLMGVSALLAILDSPDVTVSSMQCQVPDEHTLDVSWLTLSAALEATSPEQQRRLLSRGSGSAKPLDSQARFSSLEPKLKDPDFSISDLIASFKERQLSYRLKKHQVDKAALKKPAAPSLASLKPAPAFGRSQSAYFSSERGSAGNESRREVYNLVNDGVLHFKARRLEQAKQCWQKALSLDPECRQAKENLKILEKANKNRTIN